MFTLTKTSGGFVVKANPSVFGKRGRRTCYIDEDGVVHQNWGSAAATGNLPSLADRDVAGLLAVAARAMSAPRAVGP
jgi:hypothetical protein